MQIPPPATPGPTWMAWQLSCEEGTVPLGPGGCSGAPGAGGGARAERKTKAAAPIQHLEKAQVGVMRPKGSPWVQARLVSWLQL